MGGGLVKNEVPKLLFRARPGSLVTGEQAAWYLERLKNVKEVCVGGWLHFLEEDHPRRLGTEISRWLSEAVLWFSYMREKESMDWLWREMSPHVNDFSMNSRQTLETSFLCIEFPAGKTSKQVGNHLRFMLNSNHAQWEIITHNADPNVTFTLLTTNLLPTMGCVHFSLSWSLQSWSSLSIRRVDGSWILFGGRALLTTWLRSLMSIDFRVQ